MLSSEVLSRSRDAVKNWLTTSCSELPEQPDSGPRAARTSSSVDNVDSTACAGWRDETRTRRQTARFALDTAHLHDGLSVSFARNYWGPRLLPQHLLSRLPAPRGGRSTRLCPHPRY